MRKIEKSKNRMPFFFFNLWRHFFSVIYQHFRWFSVGIIENYWKPWVIWDIEISQNGRFLLQKAKKAKKGEKCEKMRFLKTPYLLQFSFFFKKKICMSPSNRPNFPKKMVMFEFYHSNYFFFYVRAKTYFFGQKRKKNKFVNSTWWEKIEKNFFFREKHFFFEISYN